MEGIYLKGMARKIMFKWFTRLFIATVFLHFVIRTAIDSYSGSIYIDYESLFLWRQLSGSFMQSHELAKSYTPSISNVQGRYLGLVKTAMPKTVNVHAILQ